MLFGAFWIEEIKENQQKKSYVKVQYEKKFLFLFASKKAYVKQGNKHHIDLIKICIFIVLRWLIVTLFYEFSNYTYQLLVANFERINARWIGA